MDRKSVILILGIAVGLLIAATQVSDGFLNIDEVMYFIGAEGFWRTGTFTIDNGFEAFGSDNLRALLLSEGPAGLTPQYPIGLTLAAYPLFGLLGQKTFIVLNVCAGIGTLFVTYALARRLFDTPQVAHIALVLLAFCSFWFEFVLAHWPHSLSVFCTTSAIYFFVLASAGDRSLRHILGLAFLSGATVGVGMFFRLEAIILLPAFGAIAILFSPKPVPVLLGGALGLMPVVAVMMLFNDIRFGTLNPLSYGTTGGATQASRHVVPAVGMVLALVGLIALRMSGGLDAKTRRTALIGGLLCVAALALSPYGGFLAKLTRGMHALLLDATSISDPRLGMFRQPDGTLLFWGFPKKALGQSLPWLGCLALLAGAAYRENKRSVAILLILFATWALPFVMRSWHGGLGSNMRYFLPTVPLLVILVSALLCKLARKAEVPVLKLPLAVAVLGFAAAFAWTTALPDRSAQLHQQISMLLLFAVATTCLLTARVPHRAFARSALVILSLAFGLSGFLGLDDLKAGQERRVAMDFLATKTATLEGPIVIYAGLATAAGAFSIPGHLVAQAHPITNEPDVALLDAACAAGYDILIARALTPFFLDVNYTVSEARETHRARVPHLVQLDCRA